MSIATTLCVLALTALVGLVLLVRGWRGRRIDDHPLCRRCCYDLHAIESPLRCPECGRDLSRRRSIRPGHRRKRRVSLALGAMLMLMALTGGGLWGWSMARDIDWQPYKPLWMLRHEAASANAVTAWRAAGEIQRRFNEHRISQSQINSIVDEALAAQVDPAKAWFTWWGEFIERTAIEDRLDDDRLSRYLINAVKPNITLTAMPPRVAQGGAVKMVLSYAPFRAGRYPSPFAMESERLQILLGGRDTWQGGASRFEIDESGTGALQMLLRVNLPPGRHRMEVQMRLRAGYALAMAVAESEAKEEFNGLLFSGWEIAEDTFTLSSEFEVVADGVKLTED